MKIKKIKKILLDKPVSVYDITVPKTHNFLLKSNIFVHNCCQLIYKAFTSPVQTNLADLAQAIERSSVTTGVRPAYYNVPRKPMNARTARSIALSMFKR